MTRQLLFSITKKDFDISTFCSGGPGGQHQNKTASGVRIVHRESGAVGESRTDRSQHKNKEYAFKRLIASPKFKVWYARKVKEILDGMSIQERVDKMMEMKNIKVEIRVNGKWVEVPDGNLLDLENELEIPD